VADNAYGVFVNSDNDTADFENSNETAHKQNGTRDDDSGKAYWGDSWAALFNDEIQGKKVLNIFFVKSDGTGFKADSKITRYFNFLAQFKTIKFFGYICLLNVLLNKSKCLKNLNSCHQEFLID
jgi:hypothetical protein